MVIGSCTGPSKQVPYNNRTPHFCMIGLELLGSALPKGEPSPCPGPSSEMPPSQLLRKLASSVTWMNVPMATRLARSWTPCLEGASSWSWTTSSRGPGMQCPCNVPIAMAKAVELEWMDSMIAKLANNLLLVATLVALHHFFDWRLCRPEMILDVQGSKAARMARRSWDICSLDWCGEVSPTSPLLADIRAMGSWMVLYKVHANCCPKVMPQRELHQRGKTVLRCIKQILT